VDAKPHFHEPGDDPLDLRLSRLFFHHNNHHTPPRDLAFARIIGRVHFLC